MSLSPLLKFALESFEHAIEQYMQGTDKSNRFSVLHCDQAIELILKEKLRAVGESIFKGSGRTLDYHDVLNELRTHKGVKIPEYPDLELIHDQRNVIQHKGATVSKVECEFCIKKGFEFIRRFLHDELNFDLEKILDSRYYDIFDSPKQQAELTEEIKVKDAVEIISLETDSSALRSHLLLKYRGLEMLLDRASKKFLKPSKHQSPEAIMKALVEDGKLAAPDHKKFKQLTEIRNSFTHTDKIPSESEVNLFMISILELKNKIRSLIKNA